LGNYENIITEFAGNNEVDKDSILYFVSSSSFGIEEVLLDDS
jgi:hypothetical protein